MASMITLAPNPILKTHTSKISFPTQDLKALVNKMRFIMKKYKGVGLAAPQIGLSLRVCVYDIGNGFNVLVNPEIRYLSKETHTIQEGCLSVPGYYFPLERHLEVGISYQDLDGKTCSKHANAYEAQVIQHEIDHLDGTIILDRIDPEITQKYLKIKTKGNKVSKNKAEKKSVVIDVPVVKAGTVKPQSPQGENNMGVIDGDVKDSERCLCNRLCCNKKCERSLYPDCCKCHVGLGPTE